MIDVLFYDDRGGFGPSFNRTHAVGGAEMHLVQVAEYLAGAGCDVFAATHSDEGMQNGVQYQRSESPVGISSVLVVVGCASLPRYLSAKRTFAFQVVDPRPHPEMFDHLKGRATMVCVSEWQASLFRALGHEAVVIPVPIPDEWYGSASGPVATIAGVRQRLPGDETDRGRPFYDFGCFSSWNKGAAETIAAWDPSWGTLAVGSPYSHPDEPPPRPGVHWLGTLRPRERWIEAMQSVGAVARICTIGETFGVVDTAAAAMGIPSYTLCTGDVGALREVGVSFFTDPAEWREAIRQRVPPPRTRDVEEFRASRVLPKWLELIGG